MGLLSLIVFAADAQKPKSEKDTLEERIEFLEGRLERMKDILRAQGLFPPDNFESPDQWTVVRIKVDDHAVIWKDGKIHDITTMSEVFKAIYSTDKFPDLKIAQHPNAPEDKVAIIYTALMKAGAPSISFESWTD